jgi:hypothetical protein
LYFGISMIPRRHDVPHDEPSHDQIDVIPFEREQLAKPHAGCAAL